MNFLRFVCLLLCQCYFLLPLEASMFKPVITNYGLMDYGSNAGVQNWACAQGRNGEIYIGNNKGLLVFNGYEWKLCPIPGSSVVRSIYVENDRVYIGAYEEFGYFTRDERGEMAYHSLSKDFQSGNIQNEEIWNIVPFRGKIYFQSFDAYFVYDGRSTKMFYDSRHKPLYFHRIGQELMVQMVDGGLFRFDGEKYHALYARSVFADDYVVAIVENSAREPVFVTEHKGLFRRTSHGIEKIKTEIDDDLSQYTVNRATCTRDGLIVIGTILNGVYAIDDSGRLRWHYDIDDGLNSNSVLRLFTDRDNNVWVALDNGVALIHSGLPYSIMKPGRLEAHLGMVYDIDKVDGRLLFATNQALYAYSLVDGRINPIPGTIGQNWHVSTFGNTTFVGNNRATFVLSGNTVHPVANTYNGSTCMRVGRINGKEVLLESTYSDLKVYREDNGHWKLSHFVKGFIAPIRQMEIDESGTVWASNINLGVYRIELSKNLDEVSNMNYYKSLPESSPTMNYVFKLRGKIVISDGRQLYGYDEISGKIIRNKRLMQQLPPIRSIHSCTAVDDHTFWFSGNDGYYLLGFNNGKYLIKQFIPVGFFGLQYNDYNDKVLMFDNVAYFNMNDGVAAYRMDAPSIKRVYPNLQVDSVICFRSDGKSTRFLLNDIATTPNAEKNITFFFSFPNFNREKLSFHFQLKGYDEWRKVSDRPMVAFSNLDYGRYVLNVKVLDESGRMVGNGAYPFRITRPFFLSVGAVLAYVLVALLLIYLLFKWRVRKILQKKQREYEIACDKRNIRLLEQEKLIAIQQQQILESELSFKSKELASLALSLSAKEKVLENLKENIAMQRNKGGLANRDLENLLKTIETENEDKVFWTIYQNNFDLINEGFFRKLRKCYPTLTAVDLRFCALLRLNLSTKDIAKFTNLTIRGVEAARYRLRKKMNVPEKQSLTEFLIDFQYASGGESD